MSDPSERPANQASNCACVATRVLVGWPGPKCQRLPESVATGPLMVLRILLGQREITRRWQAATPMTGRRSAMSDARIGQHFGQQFQPIAAVRVIPNWRTIQKTAGQAMYGPLSRCPERL